MIRWKFVLIRVVAVVAILTLLRWGMGPLARWATVTGISSATGAKVEIADAGIGLFPPTVRYRDVQIADPRSDKEFRNLLRADLVELVIDGDALLRRRWVAQNGRVSGLELGARRETSGHIETEPESTESASDEQVSLLDKLVSGATDRLEGKAESVLSEMETARRSKEIRQRWQEEYGSLSARAKLLEKKIRGLRDRARDIKNPLRDYAILEETLAEANRVRTELAEARELLNALPRKVQQDLQLLDEAKRIDLEKLDEYVPGELANSDRFGVDLVTQAVRDQLQQLREYLDHGRTIANATVVAPENERVRGTSFDLLGDNRPPQLLIRRCEVNGRLRSGGKRYTVTGVVRNLTPTPEQLKEPTQARLRMVAASEAKDAAPIELEFVQDRRDGADVDRLTFLWPRTDAGSLQLAAGKNVGVDVRGGQRELWAQIVRRGDILKGRVVSKQTGLQMQLRVPDQFDESPVAESLRDSLATVDRIEIDARFEGSWNDLDIDLETNLQRIFKDATEDAIADQLAASKQLLAAKINETHLEQVRELRGWLETHQQQASLAFAEADQSIEAMFERVTRGLGSADSYLGKLRSSLRR